ncbi:hypothetical protein DL767_007768 [Monosporascus sp. MG133]|nr:hypothetical protein DL767_007768 [Monosporascus sp. MG133]
MGSFVFKWDHPASEVYVTGTFDDWNKTEQLDKVEDHFEKNVTLPDASKKIYYKFVVDGNWVIDHTAPKEIDESGNENNILEPKNIITEPPVTTAMMSSAAPDSTTAALAAGAPLEKKDEEGSDLPGTFPVTPAAELSINPMPAAPGALNPITLAPGENIPEAVSAESTTSNVKLDPESYEKSDTLPGGIVPFSSAAPESTTAVLAAGAPIESSIPEVVKESQEKAQVDPEASAVQGEVDEKTAVEKELLEKVKEAPATAENAVVPEIVKDSQEKAHVEPEASAVPEEVQGKATVEKELLGKLREAPTTSEGTTDKGTEKTEDTVNLNEAIDTVAAAVTAAGGAVVAAAVTAKDTIAEKAVDVAATAQTTATEAATGLPETIKEKLPEPVQSAIGGTEKEETREEVSPELPSEVRESIVEAEKAPEAAANTEAVIGKKEVEAELLKEVKPTKATDDPEDVSPEVPLGVKDSIVGAGKDPEAAANTEAVVEKKEVEAELLEKVKPAEAVGEPSKAETPAAETKAEAPVTEAKVDETVAEIRTETATAEPKAEAAPAETNGASAVTDPTTPAKPAETTATSSTDKREESPTKTEKKKKNRLSALFSKLRGKVSHK